jgi:hypothetical protein
MRFYDFNIRIQIARYMGSRLYKPGTMGLAWSLSRVLEALKSDLIQVLRWLKSEMSYSCATIVIEKMLNDEFDPSLRRITIVNRDTPKPVPATIRLDSEGPNPDDPADDTIMVRIDAEVDIDDEAIDTAVLTLNEEQTGGYDFWVVCPVNFTPDVQRMIGRVNRYRTAGKLWAIYLFQEPTPGNIQTTVIPAITNQTSQ